MLLALLLPQARIPLRNERSIQHFSAVVTRVEKAQVEVWLSSTTI